MPINHPLVKFSTFPKRTPITFVITDLATAEIIYDKYVKYHIFFPDDPKRKIYEVIIPKYKFLNEYLKYPVSERKRVGSKNLLIELERDYNKQMTIHKIARFIE